MPNNYFFVVAHIDSDRIRLHGYMGTNTKTPQQPTVIEVLRTSIHTNFFLGQKVQVDMTLTPYINGVAQAAVTP